MSNSLKVLESGQASTYVDLDGYEYLLKTLHGDEQSLIQRLQDFATAHGDWVAYSNFWMPQVSKVYEKRGLTRDEITKTVGWRIAQDIGARLGLASGMMGPSDYRSEIEQLIVSRFKTRRAFCEATGISEDMLSHVLARRKNLALDTLQDALGRIGYSLRIMPAPTLSNT
jgi:hypothetical protein